MKRCSKCEKWKDESAFGKKPSKKDGLSSWCKKCVSEATHEYYWRKKKRAGKYTLFERRHRVVDGLKQKRCSGCRKWKAESEFYKNRTHKDGLAYRCKECADKATNAARRQRMAAGNRPTRRPEQNGRRLL